MTMTETLLDARGLKCPLPVLKAEKLLAQVPVGTRVVILATDPMAKIDIPHFCRQQSYAVTIGQTDDVLRFEIVKSG